MSYPHQMTRPPVSSLDNQSAKPETIPSVCEESLVDDERSGVRPAQMVDRKLNRLMKNSILFASHLRLNNLILARCSVRS